MRYYIIFVKSFPLLFTRFAIGLLLASASKTGLLIGFCFILVDQLGTDPVPYAAILVACFLSLYVSQNLFYRSMIAYSHRLLEKLRNETLRRYAKLPLLESEKIPFSQAYSGIVVNMETVFHEIPHLIVFTDGFFTILLCAIYLKYVSFPAFLIYNLMLLFVAGLSYEQKRRSDKNAASLALAEDAYTGILENSILGIKEIRLDKHTADATDKVYWSAVSKSLDISRKLVRGHVESASLGFWTYLGTGIVVFLLPKNGLLPVADLPQVLLCIFFMNSSFLRIVVGFTGLWRVENALQNILDFNKMLNKKTGEAEKGQVLGEVPEHPVIFEHGILLKGFGFEYPVSNGATSQFSLGPLDLEIVKNEILFIVGGNGSGKSSFLKALTGLYPWLGDISVDGQSITAGNMAEYQSLFSIIFTDFHLFDKAYGLERVKPEHINHWIDVMGMSDKTVYQDGAFSTTDLSTGQRKRLALISAIAENKQIYIFDEVAADQDPENRKFFYEQVLPDLKKMGKTVIAASHDDHYFHAADRVIELKDGKLWQMPDLPKAEE